MLNRFGLPRNLSFVLNEKEGLPERRPEHASQYSTIQLQPKNLLFTRAIDELLAMTQYLIYLAWLLTTIHDT